MFRSVCHGFLLLTILSAPQTQADDIPGIGPVGDAQRLHTDFAFTEGPAADGNGNLYFTDIPNNRIHKRDAKGTLSVFAEPSGHCNGLMVVGDRLLACEMDGQLKQYDLTTGKQTSLASKYNGERFNAPNDLVIDKTGGIYFTDPRFRAPEPWPQGKEAVYYRAADGKVTRLIDDRTAPNGVILSPDEKTLYVVPSMEKQMWAYAVESPGKISKGKVFCEVTQPEGKDNTGGDGLTIDTNGNLYITTALGLQVFDKAGKQLGIIKIPEHPANVAFGGKDNKTLYVTARKSLYAVETKATGHVFPGK
ncbi:SMP-30/gluconolactonase/LRE family protein [Fuerstiella marisgermanici]|uniref:Gluconolactonase n=1 Tax=Fuerstiella marisgermanici TaxID=1891926 RepID=A0A1P8WNZ5_9PLAN|nr:SMP-30/gluconolactonase/LRE family protein [Fuerstiella marisgermanici]APZ95783.1 Gluconolactonase precursor [Fuerstiella marisgermanici]